jgi:signal transduction histidine kinase
VTRPKGYAVLAVVCLFYWFLDSIWSYVSFEYNLKKLIFSEPGSYLDTFLLRVPPYQIVSRIMVVCLFTVLGILIIEFFKKRQAAEKDRKEAHDTFLTVLNSIDATIYAADMHTHEILFMNKYMIDRFGGDFTGRICHEVFRNSREVCGHCRNDELVDASGNPKDVVVWEDQNPVVNAWYVNYDRAIKWPDGRIVHLQIAFDVTQFKELEKKQKKAEEQLRQAQKMEAIGNLAGGIAHDFNNLLASIIGFTELAIGEVQKGTSLESSLQEVYSAGQRAKDLVKQILAFARQSDEERSPIQPGIVAKEIQKFIRSTIPSTIDICHHIESEAWIMGNVTQIHQVLMNLCTNAAHAMEDAGGVLEISVKDVILEKEALSAEIRPGAYVEIKVTDTGIGIPPEIVESIFDPYFTTKGPGEGTGLGLAMAQGIVESYGGKITVESQLGKGTTFTLYLPMIEKQSDQDVSLPEPLPTGTERILFVDDEAAITEIGKRILEQLGYSVDIRTSSTEALALFKAKPEDFDLLLTDMTMPDLTGDRLAVEVMTIRPDLPVILCTGYSKKVSEETAATLGIKAFVYKPVVKADLAKTVRKVLDEVQK